MPRSRLDAGCRWALRLLVLGIFTTGPRILAADADSTLARVDTSKALLVAESLFVQIDDDGHAILKVHQIVRVKSASAARTAAFARQENADQHLASVVGRQYDAAGVVVDSIVGKKSLTKICGYGAEFTLYSDACTYLGEFKTRRVPYVVEWEYTMKLDNVGLWSGWSPPSRLFLQSGLCEIRAHPANKFRYAVQGDIVQEKPEITTTDIIRRWTAKNLPPVDIEDAEPWPSRRFNRLYAIAEAFDFAGKSFAGSNWRSLSASFYSLVEPAFKSNSALESLVKKSSSVSPDSQLVAMHRALTARLRYVAIYLGLGGWIPHPSDKTFDLGYGDCKDLATLYAVLFAKAGTQTRTALISTRNQEYVDSGRHTIGLFNHVIMLYISGNDTTWVDPTCFDCALGDLPYSVEGVNALILDPDSGDLVETPGSDCRDNLLRRNFAVELAEDLGARFSFSGRFAGNSAHGLRGYVSGTDAGVLALTLGAVMGIDGLPAIDNKSISVASPGFSQVELGLEWSKLRFAKKAADALIVDLSDIRLLSGVEMLDLGTRKHALEIGYPRTVIDTIRITAPAGFAWKTLPDSVSYNSDFGDLQISGADAADTATIIRSLSRKQNIIEPEQFEAYQQFRKDISARGRAIATLVKK